jgi:DNA-binding LytR/AlgR family response regulator
MKIGICDDAAESRKQTADFCRELGYNKIFLFNSGKELLNSPECFSLTLLFLDIEMCGMNGIEVKNILEQSSPSTFIVFLTSHQELMPNAFGRNVIFFLSKPLSKHSLEIAIEKAAFLTKDFVPIRIDKKTELLCKNILYLHAEQKYTVFYTENGESFLSRKSLKYWGENLDKLGFCSISRATIINLKHFVSICKKNVILRGNISLPISRRYIALLNEQFNSYMLHMMNSH